MKAYQKQLNASHFASRASKCCPVLPVLSKDDVPVDVEKAFAYDNNGNYLGHAEVADVKKFLLTRLYYKTKGAYSVKTRRYYSDCYTINIYEKGTSNIALLFRCRKLKVEDTIDADDKLEQVRYSLENEFKDFKVSSYQMGHWSIPTADKFNLTTEFRKELEIEIRAVIEAKKQKMLNHLNSFIEANKLLQDASIECGLELDI
jgi:hypothetical protein